MKRCNLYDKILWHGCILLSLELPVYWNHSNHNDQIHLKWFTSISWLYLQDRSVIDINSSSFIENKAVVGGGAIFALVGSCWTPVMGLGGLNKLGNSSSLQYSIFGSHCFMWDLHIYLVPWCFFLQSQIDIESPMSKYYSDRRSIKRGDCRSIISFCHLHCSPLFIAIRENRDSVKCLCHWGRDKILWMQLLFIFI